MSGTPKKWGRADQWDAQNGLCWICLKPMEHTCKLPDSVTEDHLVSKSRGGKGGWRNKLLAHKLCNNLRAAPFIWVPLNEFRRAAMKRVRGGHAVQATIIDGIDLGCSHVVKARASKRALTSRLATVPSKMASKPLRVPLVEVSPIPFTSAWLLANGYTSQRRDKHG